MNHFPVQPSDHLSSNIDPSHVEYLADNWCRCLICDILINSANLEAHCAGYKHIMKQGVAGILANSAPGSGAAHGQSMQREVKYWRKNPKWLRKEKKAHKKKLKRKEENKRMHDGMIMRKVAIARGIPVDNAAWNTKKEKVISPGRDERVEAFHRAQASRNTQQMFNDEEDQLEMPSALNLPQHSHFSNPDDTGSKKMKHKLFKCPVCNDDIPTHPRKIKKHFRSPEHKLLEKKQRDGSANQNVAQGKGKMAKKHRRFVDPADIVMHLYGNCYRCVLCGSMASSVTHMLTHCTSRGHNIQLHRHGVDPVEANKALGIDKSNGFDCALCGVYGVEEEQYEIHLNSYKHNENVRCAEADPNNENGEESEGKEDESGSCSEDETETGEDAGFNESNLQFGVCATSSRGHANRFRGYATSSRGYATSSRGYPTSSSGYATSSGRYNTNYSRYTAGSSGYGTGFNEYATSSSGFIEPSHEVPVDMFGSSFCGPAQQGGGDFFGGSRGPNLAQEIIGQFQQALASGLGGEGYSAVNPWLNQYGYP